MYDRVLKVRKEKGCELIGYADDTLIMSVARTYEEAKYNICMQTDRTIRAIRNLGLKVADGRENEGRENGSNDVPWEKREETAQ